jgi:UDP-N-acetylmuramyl pentapeptide phosphotransferase/UDP-N-acetylglucosamine-1-phosphate transferase
VLAAGSCGAFVVAAEPLTIPLLQRAAAIDVPSLRSSHTVPTPRGGGAPIAVGLVLAGLLIHGATALTFAAAVAIFGAIGFADDLRGLPVRRRLLLQSAGSAVVASLLVARLGLPPAAKLAAAAVLAVWVIGFVNAFNFMDGVNGISAAHAVIGGAAYACLGAWDQDAFLVAVGAAVAVGALAFLPWNAVRARVFLGDVGSYGLGAALAVLAACAVLRGIPVEAVAGPVALYLSDTAWTLQRRIRAGESWLEPHRTHTYQRLCDAGWSHQRVTLATGAVTSLLSLLGTASLIGHPVLRVAADAAGICLLGVYLRSPGLLARARAVRNLPTCAP